MDADSIYFLHDLTYGGSDQCIIIPNKGVRSTQVGL